VSSANCLIYQLFLGAGRLRCSKSVYGFAYDDAVGLRVCKGATTFTLCPKP
jgi:hypothetical protein